MSKQTTNHYRAAEHHEHAANHHREAEKAGVAGDHIAAAYHAQTARGHAVRAAHYSDAAALDHEKHHGMTAEKRETGNEERVS